ncbi:MAG TPA: mechanosensitive ion channel [Clostridiaceae bacterium]|nr:mechanosensitive ion channel [Clostridiaceae bacterium]
MITILSEQVSQNNNSLRNFLEYSLFDRSVKLWLAAFIVILSGFLFKGILGHLLAKIISRIKINDYDLGTKHDKQFKKVLSWILPLTACKIAVSYVLKAGPTIEGLINTLLSSLFIILALRIVELICRKLFSFWHEKDPEKLTETVCRFLLQIIRAVLIILGLIMILSLLQINVAGIITGLGLGGLAVSMAAKDYLTDLIAGFSIMSEKTFEINDYIKAPDIEGIVENIKFRQTQVRTFDQGLMAVPNSKLTRDYVINYSRMGKRRLRFMVNLPTFVTLEQIAGLKKLLADYIEQNNNVTEDNPLLVTFSINPDKIEFLVQYFITSIVYADFVQEQDQILRLIWDYLSTEKIADPITQITILDNEIITDEESEETQVSGGIKANE